MLLDALLHHRCEQRDRGGLGHDRAPRRIGEQLAAVEHLQRLPRRARRRRGRSRPACAAVIGRRRDRAGSRRASCRTPCRRCRRPSAAPPARATWHREPTSARCRPRGTPERPDAVELGVRGLRAACRDRRAARHRHRRRVAPTRAPPLQIDAGSSAETSRRSSSATSTFSLTMPISCSRSKSDRNSSDVKRRRTSSVSHSPITQSSMSTGSSRPVSMRARSLLRPSRSADASACSFCCPSACRCARRAPRRCRTGSRAWPPSCRRRRGPRGCCRSCRPSAPRSQYLRRRDAVALGHRLLVVADDVADALAVEHHGDPGPHELEEIAIGCDDRGVDTLLMGPKRERADRVVGSLPSAMRSTGMRIASSTSSISPSCDVVTVSRGAPPCSRRPWPAERSACPHRRTRRSGRASPRRAV